MKRILLSGVLLVALLFGCAEQTNMESEASSRESAVETSQNNQSEATQVSAPEVAPASNDLKTDTPESQGVDGALLAALHTAVEEAKNVDVWSLVIVKNGVIVDEYYGIDDRNGKQFDENDPFYLASCTKSVMGTLIGIAIDEGLIDGVDVKLSEYFPTLADADDGRESITLGHLLTHTSGLQWDEWNGGGKFQELQRAENRVDFVLVQPMAAAPGSTFNYNSGGSHLLSAVLEQATGQSAFDFGREQLFTPLGMDSVNWPADPQGITDGGSGIEMTARDAAKLGLLYLNGGRWRERQVVSQGWVEQSTTPQIADTIGRTGQYGYQWWMRPFGDRNHDTFFAMGGGGHFIFVVPELELVVAMTCYNNGDSYAPWPFFTDYILPACE